MKCFFVLALTVLSLSFAGGVYAEGAQGAKSGPRYSNVHSLEKFKEALNLSETQVQEIDVLNKSFREKYKSNHDRMKPLEDRLREMEKSGSVDYATMETLLKDIAAIHTVVRLDKIKHHHALMAQLNPEQKEAFKKKREAMREKMKENRKEKFRGNHK
jgi:Spy/CpxP family protein refolding chaperone